MIGELLIWFGWIAAIMFCLIGIMLSLISFTGAWLIALSAVMLILLRADDAPGWWVAGMLLAGSAALEVFDFFAAKWGVARRGGSSAAGWAALFGGLGGMLLGSLIPLPVIGSLVGLIAGSYFAAYHVERRRLLRDDAAAHIARGAVWARLMVMLVKTMAAIAMTFYLWYSLLT